MDPKIQDKIVIIDIGSTTTKALLLEKENNNYKIVGYEVSPTTVEKPFEDVKIGIYRVVELLGRFSPHIYAPLLSPHIYGGGRGGNDNVYNGTKSLYPSLPCPFPPPAPPINVGGESPLINVGGVMLLCTSSAGGGLQILAAGLTKLDSTAAAKRTILSVGGVLLNVVSSDDGKSLIEKLTIFNTSHPDIILQCGGTDGGALAGVYRMAEIINLANITHKFSPDSKISLVFAGNKEATHYINLMLNKKFKIAYVPNIRPSLKGDNLEPAKKKIFELYMNNVMEDVPGYSSLKNMVSSDILPTPAAVLKAIEIMSKKYNHITAFDIGGATTDTYTNHSGHIHRSVSGNLGMSYSIGNVLKESDFSMDILPYLDVFFKGNKNIQELFLNYTGNKIIYPTFNPDNDLDKFFEHILAINSIKMSIKQHFETHFIIKKKNVLEVLFELGNIVPFVGNAFIRSALGNRSETIFPKAERINAFPTDGTNKIISYYKYDKKILIGAGGVISAATKNQAIFMIIEALKPEYISELWRDKRFISPHLGVLSSVNETIASHILENDCYEKLCIYINPKIKSFGCFKFILNGTLHKVKANDLFYYLPSSKTKIILFFYFFQKEIELESDLPLIIDTRIDTHSIYKKIESNRIILDILKPYSILPSVGNAFIRSALGNKASVHNIFHFPKEERINAFPTDGIIIRSLPYLGTIFVKENDSVTPDQKIGENKFNPPKFFIILIPSLLRKKMTEMQIRNGLLVKEKDTLFCGQLYFSEERSKGSQPNPSLRGTKQSIPNKKNLDCFVPRNDEWAQRIQDVAQNEKSNLEFTKDGSFLYIAGNNKSKLFSPLNAEIEQINYETGTLLLSVIQNYALNPVEINLFNELKISNLKKYLLKKQGDFVNDGDVIAEEPFIGLKKLYSPCTGTIKNIDYKKGIMTIHYDTIVYELYANCFGKVDKIINNSVYIATNSSLIEGKIGFGREVSGDFVVYPSDDIDIKGKIVYTNQTITSSLIEYFVRSEIKGLICESISYPVLHEFLGEHIGIALTGNEKLPFSLIILQGFGESSEPYLDFMNIYKYALLQPHTQIRAGVSRPKIYFFAEG